MQCKIIYTISLIICQCCGLWDVMPYGFIDGYSFRAIYCLRLHGRFCLEVGESNKTFIFTTKLHVVISDDHILVFTTVKTSNINISNSCSVSNSQLTYSNILYLPESKGRK